MSNANITSKKTALLSLSFLTALVFAGFAAFTLASPETFGSRLADNDNRGEFHGGMMPQGPRFDNRFTPPGIEWRPGFRQRPPVELQPANWEPQWHDPNEWINTGKIINAEQLGETLKYLYSMASVNRNFRNCTFSISQPRECEITYSCNCGKYGCSTCKTKSTRRDLIISCPNKPDLEFTGVCVDPRKAQRCGKYGCTSI